VADDNIRKKWEAVERASINKEWLVEIELLKELEAAGEIGATVELGIVYQEAPPPHGNAEKAIECFQFAADKGNLEGTLALALTYLEGWGVERDYRRALSLYKSALYAAERAGNEFSGARAMYALGCMCYQGLGTAVDLERAAEYLRCATELGHVMAPRLLSAVHWLMGQFGASVYWWGFFYLRLLRTAIRGDLMRLTRQS